MDPFVFGIALAAIYLAAFFFDCFFKSCMHYPYDAFLRNTGLTIKFLRLDWYTTALNRSIFRWGTVFKKFLIPSFSLGVIVALCLLPLGLILLFMTLFNSQSSDTAGVMVTNPKIEVLLPGVNLPLDEIGYYVSTLLLSTLVHELGHALAAVIEDVPITGFGFHVYFCIPLAYTEISSEHLNSLKWIKRLRILCAGIWHNVILSLFCFILLSSMGIFAAPFYSLNDSIIVKDITNKSPLLGDRGLYKNDIITMINDCRVNNVDSWYDCLIRSIRSKSGYCVSSDFIRLNDESVQISHHDGIVQCCDPRNQKLCCFEYTDDLSNEDPIEIPQHVCLDVRKTIEDSYGFCSGTCEKGFCMRPSLSNTTTIINIRRKNKLDVIYIGHPADISRSVRISPFVPKTDILSPEIGDAIILFLKYNIVFSLGLGVINSIPCFSLDGYHISSTIINNFLVNRIAERAKRDLIVLMVTGLGTVLFLLAVLKVIWVSFLTNLI